MPKITEAYCEICKKKYTSDDIIEVDRTFTCPSCNSEYINKFKTKSITCNNPECYKHEKSLLVDIDFLEHQKEVQELNAKISKAISKDLKELTNKISEINNKFRKKMEERDVCNFDYDSLKYKCYECNNIMARSEWKKENMKCPECGESQTMTVESSKVKFSPYKSKHIIACCPKYHVLGRYPNHDS